MNYTIKLTMLLLAIIINSPCIAKVTVSVQDSPSNPQGFFSANISAASTTDRTPNPCYARVEPCTIKFITIDESWLPSGVPNGGRETYWSEDQGFKTRHWNASRIYPTLGEWWSDVIDKNRVGRTRLVKYGDSPCVVLAVETDRGMVYGSVLSNCAKGNVQFPICSMSVQTIDIQKVIVQGQEMDDTSKGGVSLSCNYTSDIKIETDANGEIPLRGNRHTVAVLDWGNGYGRPGSYHVKRGKTIPVRLRVKTRGLRGADAGVYAGTAVVKISYQ